ncbi:MAG: ROK family protein [Lentisphaeria bacterium]|nr:ROK family protein [Lentisphaeria bacterium]NQZ70930.1 ROK family protein [Lentisphaeria bacterium]
MPEPKTKDAPALEKDDSKSVSLQSKGEINTRLVRSLIFQQGPISRVEISNITQMSLATLTAICAELLESGVVLETDALHPSDNNRGRRRRPLRINSENLGCISMVCEPGCIDVAVVDLNGDIRWHQTFEVEFEVEPYQICLRSALAAALAASPIETSKLLEIGVAVPDITKLPDRPAKVDSHAGIWAEIEPGETVKGVAPLPVFVDKIESLMAIGEMTSGAGQDSQTMLLLSWDNELNGALVDHGRLIRGADSDAAKIGHAWVSDTDTYCSCGLKGCLNIHLASEKIIAQWQAARLAMGDNSERIIEDHRKIIELASEGDGIAAGILAESAELLAQVVGPLANILRIDRIILSADFGAENGPMVHPFYAALRKYVSHSFYRDLEVRSTALGLAGAHKGVVAQTAKWHFAMPNSTA